VYEEKKILGLKYASIHAMYAKFKENKILKPFSKAKMHGAKTLRIMELFFIYILILTRED
jgi:endo-1,4-beta-mannosidase